MSHDERNPADPRQGVDEGDSGYPEEQPAGADPGPSDLRRHAATADEAADRAPDTDEGHTATGNPGAAG
jgi:hypothetical protein